MSRLTELIQEVNEDKLDKAQLEAYREELNKLYGLMELENADLEKRSALFYEECPETTQAAKERKWNVTKEGQRQIELKHYVRIMEKMISSVKSRLYNVY